jgi:uncharacterized membrane protein
MLKIFIFLLITIGFAIYSVQFLFWNAKNTKEMFRNKSSFYMQNSGSPKYFDMVKRIVKDLNNKIDTRFNKLDFKVDKVYDILTEEET